MIVFVYFLHDKQAGLNAQPKFFLLLLIQFFYLCIIKPKKLIYVLYSDNMVFEIDNQEIVN
jgi:hypothetical protein